MPNPIPPVRRGSACSISPLANDTIAPSGRHTCSGAPDNSGIGLWVRAKLALRGGKLDSAAELLARASRAFPDNEEWAAKGGYEFEEGMRPSRRAAGELGVLRLARGQYVDALDTLMKGRWWLDAAYIAERVLTVDELLRYCKADPKPVARHKSDSSAQEEPDNSERLRELLARRLTRLGRWKEARPFFPPRLKEKLDSYIQAIRAGHEENRSALDRGKSLWSAARIARESGLELLGTELDPDDTVVEGRYQHQGFDVAANRSRHDQYHPSKLLLPTSDELRRAAAAAPDPNKRWHYRYIAADHAWTAAELLPDNSDETARILYDAGIWLIPRDPQAADRFYRALVSRFATTALGKAALAHKWLPPADDPAVAALPH